MLGRKLGGPGVYDCSACEKNPTMKQLLGHDGAPQSYWRENLVSGERLAECPLRTWVRAREQQRPLFDEIDRYLSTYHPAYRKGFLLVAGGIADQPARYLAMVQHIDAVWDQVDAKLVAIETEGAT